MDFAGRVIKHARGPEEPRYTCFNGSKERFSRYANTTYWQHEE